jgi:molecular chaperone IbpA
MFDNFQSMFDDDFISDIQPSYPPYNIVKSGKNTYDIEVALAGFNKKDINVNVEDGMLTIESVKDEAEKEVEDNDGTLYRGISKRMFKRSFTIANDVNVTGAELKDGLLRVSMEKIIPEEKKLKTIQVK